MIKTVEQAEAELAAAFAASLEETRQDMYRSDGSGAQEGRREAHQQSLREAVARCERGLEEAKRHQPMVLAFEAKYQRDWKDPTGDEMKAVWAASWAAARASA